MDWLAAITDWVEHAHAPDKRIASKPGPGTHLITRPLYPYPQVAIYQGSGDPTAPKSDQ